MIPFLSHCDDALFLCINSHHTRFFDAFFYLVTWLGNGWVVTPILLFISFVKVPRKRLWLFILVSAVGMIASGLINSKIKDTTHRPRPLVYFSSPKADSASASVSGAPYKVHIVGKPLSYRAFPSGHTNTAFSAAILVALAFGGWYWLAVIPAMLVGYSRIYIGAHFPLDVVAGGLLGIFVMIVTVVLIRIFVLSSRPPVPSEPL
jgi:membrane-associated phospholipid phosphatase